ncbi:hypothetical protein SARC_11856 [Sphaeroforma arctica JP610]|uniref:AB hydrolase-1 domain-containing protein n=1 Tax=Sphaeroforma arctica JP610 TaxID=667725 RepID=A0A0L0FFS4_9EUKA|nr:hypothetical protein SARC_11856 [Sphaeroforma arctica JP610]KNC75622.1 hypothetical protein SARC_11856 [Sphaeroforma arctica JP610]|eukprot:XP_014149524.1 hypothetical protein SARC_11856 [Sphaeroforma arctica JP610]
MTSTFNENGLARNVTLLTFLSMGLAYYPTALIAMAVLTISWYVWDKYFVLPSYGRRSSNIVLDMASLENVGRHLDRFSKDMSVKGTWKIRPHTTHRISIRDGVTILYHVLAPNDPKLRNKKVMLFCSGLGVHGFHAFTPLIHFYGPEWTYIAWDYRGLFGSSVPENPRHLAIHEHSKDAKEILQHMGIGKVDVCVAHSMGVQVALEFALLYPEVPRSLVMINGTHGKAFHTGGQPFFRLPLMGDIVYHLMTFWVQRPHYIEMYIKQIRYIALSLARIYGYLFGNKYLKEIMGSHYMEDFVQCYLYDANAGTIQAFFRTFLELDAHSVYHLLSEVKQPTLVISGLLDVMIPAYCGSEMAAQIPTSKFVLDWWSAHLTLLENPWLVVASTAKFLDQHNIAHETRRLSNHDL